MKQRKRRVQIRFHDILRDMGWDMRTTQYLTKDNLTLKKVNTKNYVGWGLFENNELKFKAPEVKYCIEYIKENYNGN